MQKRYIILEVRNFIVTVNTYDFYPNKYIVIS